MAGASISLDYKIKDRRVRTAFRKLEKAGDHTGPMFADIGEYLLLSTHERFSEQRSPSGEPWAELSEATLRRRALKKVSRGKGESRKRLTKRRGGTKAAAIRAIAGAQILRESGILQDTLAYFADDGQLEMGTNEIYGATQQYGDDDRNIPAREYLGLSIEDDIQVQVIVLDHYHTALLGR